MPDPIVDPIVEQIRKSMLQFISPAYRQQFQQVPITREPWAYSPTTRSQYGSYAYPPWNEIAVGTNLPQELVMPTLMHETAHSFSIPQWGVKQDFTFPQNNPGFNFTLNPYQPFNPLGREPIPPEKPPLGFFWDNPANYQGRGWQPFTQTLFSPPGVGVVNAIATNSQAPGYGFSSPMEAYAETARLVPPEQRPQQFAPYYPWQQPAPIQPEPTQSAPPNSTPWNYVMPPEQYAQWRQGEY